MEYLVFLLLVSLLLLDVNVQAIHLQSITNKKYKYSHVIDGLLVRCVACPPGTHWKAHCSSSDEASTVCLPCMPGKTYNTAWGRQEYCARCRDYCPHKQVKTDNCSPVHDTICQCIKAFFKNADGICIPDRPCGKGKGVTKEGTRTSKTQCDPCKKGFYSNEYSYYKPCYPKTNCASKGLSVFRIGNSTADNVCYKIIVTPKPKKVKEEISCSNVSMNNRNYTGNNNRNDSNLTEVAENISRSDKGMELQHGPPETCMSFIILMSISIFCNVVFVLAIFKPDFLKNICTRPCPSEIYRSASQTSDTSFEEGETSSKDQLNATYDPASHSTSVCVYPPGYAVNDPLQNAIDKVVNSIGLDWKMFVRKIRNRLSECDIQHIDHANSRQLKEATLQALLQWRNNTSDACVADIVKACKEINNTRLAEEIEQLIT